MKFGFELESSAPFSSTRKMKYALKRGLGQSFYEKTILNVVEDVSVASYVKDIPAEIITKPLPKKQAIKALIKITDWMIANDCHTDSSCGLHINMSHAGQNKIDPVSFLWTIDHNKMLKDYGRTKLEYCKPWEEYAKYVYKESLKKEKYAWVPRDSMGIFTRSFAKVMVWFYTYDLMSCRDDFNKNAINSFSSKHICFNLNYLKSRGYLECRIPGGDYLKKIDPLVLQTIYDLEEGFLKSCDSSPKFAKNLKALEDMYRKFT